jgi:hypothetical protein
MESTPEKLLVLESVFRIYHVAPQWTISELNHQGRVGVRLETGVVINKLHLAFGEPQD